MVAIISIGSAKIMSLALAHKAGGSIVPTHEASPSCSMNQNPCVPGVKILRAAFSPAAGMAKVCHGFILYSTSDFESPIMVIRNMQVVVCRPRDLTLAPTKVRGTEDPSPLSVNLPKTRASPHSKPGQDFAPFLCL